MKGSVQVVKPKISRGVLERSRLFFTSKEVNWKRIWLIVLISFPAIYFSSCAYFGISYGG